MRSTRRPASIGRRPTKTPKILRMCCLDTRSGKLASKQKPPFAGALLICLSGRTRLQDGLQNTTPCVVMPNAAEPLLNAPTHRSSHLSGARPLSENAEINLCKPPLIALRSVLAKHTFFSIDLRRHRPDLHRASRKARHHTKVCKEPQLHRETHRPRGPNTQAIRSTTR